DASQMDFNCCVTVCVHLVGSNLEPLRSRARVPHKSRDAIKQKFLEHEQATSLQSSVTGWQQLLCAHGTSPLAHVRASIRLVIPSGRVEPGNPTRSVLLDDEASGTIWADVHSHPLPKGQNPPIRRLYVG